MNKYKETMEREGKPMKKTRNIKETYGKQQGKTKETRKKLNIEGKDK